jgi:hypothetical protein
MQVAITYKAPTLVQRFIDAGVSVEPPNVNEKLIPTTPQHLPKTKIVEDGYIDKEIPFYPTLYTRNYPPLHIAIQSNTVDCLRCLVRAGANSNVRYDTSQSSVKYESTPLHSAIFRPNLAMVKCLVEESCNPDQPIDLEIISDTFYISDKKLARLFKAPNSNQNPEVTPWGYADSKRGSLDSQEAEYGKIADYLLGKGAKPTKAIGYLRPHPFFSYFGTMPGFANFAQANSSAEKPSKEQQRLEALKVLDLTDNATDKEIRAKYFKLARTTHPDHDDTPGAKERFQALSAAYQCLSDDASSKRFKKQ